VLLGFLVLLVAAVYGIVERLAGPRLGALAALVTATSPGVVLFSREYVFALPAAALLACAVYALIRSEGLRRTRWAVLTGVALGLMVLTRTVTVAFVPGVALAAVVALVARGPEGRRRAVANLALAALAMVAVAATWYWRNLQPVTDYLTSVGYGRGSGAYGEQHPLLSWSRWTTVAEHLGRESLHLWLFAALTVGAVGAAFLAVRRVLPSEHRRATAAALARSDSLTVAIVLAAGYAALSSSRNPGYGFTVPLVALLVTLALLWARELPALRLPLAALLVAVAVFNVASHSGVSSALAEPRTVSVPAIGDMPATDGQPLAVGYVRRQLAGPATEFAPPDKEWLPFDRRLARFFLDYADSKGRVPVVAFASRNRLVNTNSVGLAARLWWGREIAFAQLDAAGGGDRMDAYARYLSDPAHGLPNMLVTADVARGDFEPLVTQARAEAAARSLGFSRVATMTQPDGRLLHVWWLER
jgi:4-amino-4-deoxy-L-arabinose transferase-like glycosyltransferase